MTFELETDVPSNHEVTLTLPPEVPTGRVKLQVSWVAESLPGGYVRRKLHPSLVPEEDAYIRMLPELLKTHYGKYVVIRDGKLIASADSEHKALQAAFALERMPMIFLTRVWDKPVPLERLPSIREVRRGDAK